jgi:molecular chaperone DnaJ
MDLYVILGLASGAKTSDIKRAYRRLARRYHPDINPGDATAKAMYRQICDAYETLVDPDRRREYDSVGGRRSPAAPSASFEFSGFDFSAAAHGPQAATFTELFADLLHPTDSTDPSRLEVGADLHAVLTLSFVEAMTGTERQVVVTRQDLCGACNGTGHVRTTEGRCGSCHGSGSVRWARGHMVFTKTCATCRGTGRRRSERCAVCFGHGRSARSEAVAVHVPPGVQPGSGLRVPRHGHAGRNGGQNGDLFVTVHVEPHPFYPREGDDLHMRVRLGVHEAGLGARIDVPTLEGPVGLRVPPGTQAGQRFVLTDRGVPRATGGRGNLIVEVQIVLPPLVDDRARELVRELGKLYERSSPEPRAPSPELRT